MELKKLTHFNEEHKKVPMFDAWKFDYQCLCVSLKCDLTSANLS